MMQPRILTSRAACCSRLACMDQIMPQIYEGTRRTLARDANAQRAKSRPPAPALVTTLRSARSASPRATSNSLTRTARKNCRSPTVRVVLTAAVCRKTAPRMLTISPHCSLCARVHCAVRTTAKAGSNHRKLFPKLA